MWRTQPHCRKCARVSWPDAAAITKVLSHYTSTTILAARSRLNSLPRGLPNPNPNLILLLIPIPSSIRPLRRPILG
jgi:hypothetical protein